VLDFPVAGGLIVMITHDDCEVVICSRL